MPKFHDWKPVRFYEGPYVDPESKKEITTCMHDVQCQKCKEIVSLPDTMMPQETEGCSGIKAQAIDKKIKAAVQQLRAA